MALPNEYDHQEGAEQFSIEITAPITVDKVHPWVRESISPKHGATWLEREINPQVEADINNRFNTIARGFVAEQDALIKACLNEFLLVREFNNRDNIDEFAKKWTNLEIETFHKAQKEEFSKFSNEQNGLALEITGGLSEALEHIKTAYKNQIAEIATKSKKEEINKAIESFRGKINNAEKEARNILMRAVPVSYAYATSNEVIKAQEELESALSNLCYSSYWFLGDYRKQKGEERTALVDEFTGIVNDYDVDGFNFDNNSVIERQESLNKDINAKIAAKLKSEEYQEKLKKQLAETDEKKREEKLKTLYKGAIHDVYEELRSATKVKKKAALDENSDEFKKVYNGYVDEIQMKAYERLMKKNTYSPKEPDQYHIEKAVGARKVQWGRGISYERNGDMGTMKINFASPVLGLPSAYADAVAPWATRIALLAAPAIAITAPTAFGPAVVAGVSAGALALATLGEGVRGLMRGDKPHIFKRDLTQIRNAVEAFVDGHQMQNATVYLGSSQRLSAVTLNPGASITDRLKSINLNPLRVLKNVSTLSVDRDPELKNNANLIRSKAMFDANGVKTVGYMPRVGTKDYRLYKEVFEKEIKRLEKQSNEVLEKSALKKKEEEQPDLQITSDPNLKPKT